ARDITEGLDYQANYQLDTSVFGHGNFGTFTFTATGNYLDRFVRQESPVDPKANFDNHFIGVRFGSFPRNRWYTSLFYDLGGLDTGVVVHYVGQYWDSFSAPHSRDARKIREWTTLDLVVNYTFHRPQSATEPVPGYAKGAG